MFQTISRTGLGLYAYLILSVVQLLGFEVSETQIEEVVLAGATVVSFALALWGQYKRDDLDGGLWRK